MVSSSPDGFEDAASVLSTAEPDVLPSLVKGELTPKTILVALFLALILGDGIILVKSSTMHDSG